MHNSIADFRTNWRNLRKVKHSPKVKLEFKLTLQLIVANLRHLQRMHVEYQWIVIVNRQIISCCAKKVRLEATNAQNYYRQRYCWPFLFISKSSFFSNARHAIRTSACSTTSAHEHTQTSAHVKSLSLTDCCCIIFVIMICIHNFLAFRVEIFIFWISLFTKRT